MKQWIFIVVVTLANTVFAQNFLNGISNYEHLNKEYYIGALYLSEAQSDPSIIISDNRAQKMVLKVTASRWSTRKFTAFWREGLALNNDLASDVTLTTQISEFITLPQESLKTGDEFIFKYTPTSGTEVTLNNEVIFKTKGKSFFNALLRSWIGPVPHSRLFYNQILGSQQEAGSTHDSRLARFQASSIQSDRVGMVSGWKAVEQAAKLALAQAEEEIRLQKKRDEDAKRKAAADKKKRDEERKQAQLAAEKARKETELAKSKEQNAEQVKQAVEAQREAELKAAELELEAEAEKVEAKSENIAKQYASDVYRWEVLRDVYKRVSYPEWARQFEQEGIVTIEFIVGSQGQLLGITSISPADSGLLGQELKDALNRAAPFNPFPTALSDKQIRVVVDYEFTLEDRVATVPEKPSAPDGYKGESELTGVQKAVQWSKYKESVKAEIAAAIEYPFWAQDLKQQGTVTAEVTVRADGSVSKVKLKKKTRHSILNQEVEQAIDRIGTFTAFPAWVEDQTLTLLIEHTFEL
jgi:TonB family protein